MILGGLESMKKILLILLFFLIPGIVYSNSGPPIVDPIDQSIIFDEHSGISLVEEWVNVVFKEEYYKDNKELNLSKGYITVKYKLENLDATSKDLDILFLSPEINSSSIKITKNGEELSSINVEQEPTLPKNWNPDTPKEIIEPLSKKSLYETPNNIYSPNLNFTGIKFKVDFEPKQIVTLAISYESASGYYDLHNQASKVHSQIYYLTPASFWEGDSKVNLSVEFPKDSNINLYSNIPLSKTNSNTYTTSLNKIPNSEWVFTFVDSSKLIFRTNNRTLHNSLVFIILLMGILVGRVLKKKIHRLYSYLLWILSLIFFIYYIQPSYGSMFLIIFLGPWILLGLLGAVCLTIYQKNRKNI